MSQNPDVVKVDITPARIAEINAIDKALIEALSRHIKANLNVLTNGNVSLHDYGSGIANRRWI